LYGSFHISIQDTLLSISDFDHIKCSKHVLEATENPLVIFESIQKVHLFLRSFVKSL
jgi:hypothetical protein